MTLTVRAFRCRAGRTRAAEIVEVDPSKLREGHPRCAQSVPGRAATSREVVNAVKHLGLVTCTYRHRGDPLRPRGRVVAALHTSGRRFDIVRAHEGSAGRT